MTFNRFFIFQIHISDGQFKSTSVGMTGQKHLKTKRFIPVRKNVDLPLTGSFVSDFARVLRLSMKKDIPL